MINTVTLVGRLTKDPEVRFTSGEHPMAIGRFNLAVPRIVKKGAEPQADFISCVAFSKTAEVLEKYVKKGNRIAIEGRIQTGTYKDKDGKMVYTTDVVVNNIEFMEPKQQTTQVTQPSDGFMQVPDEALPFN